MMHFKRETGMVKLDINSIAELGNTETTTGIWTVQQSPKIFTNLVILELIVKSLHKASERKFGGRVGNHVGRTQHT